MLVGVVLSQIYKQKQDKHKVIKWVILVFNKQAIKDRIKNLMFKYIKYVSVHA